KRQIHAVRGHDRVVVPGHDIKLGRGGIREIEFFVQTQQLIFGGRRPQMRGARTLDMLERLHADKWVSAEAVEDLSPAYLFLPAPPSSCGGSSIGCRWLATNRLSGCPSSARRSPASPSSVATPGSTALSGTRPAISPGSSIITRGCSRKRRRSAWPRAVSCSPA